MVNRTTFDYAWKQRDTYSNQDYWYNDYAPALEIVTSHETSDFYVKDTNTGRTWLYKTTAEVLEKAYELYQLPPSKSLADLPPVYGVF